MSDIQKSEGSGFFVESALRELRLDHLARLRWRVLREFGVLPGSEPAIALEDSDYVLCALNLLLDADLPEPYEPGSNPAFDLSRFEDLGGDSFDSRYKGHD